MKRGVSIGDKLISWGKKEEYILAEMAKEGASLEEICKVLTGRTSQAVRCKIHRMGLESVEVRKSQVSVDYDAFKEFMKSVGKVVEV